MDEMMNRMIINIFGALGFISLISGIGAGVWSASMFGKSLCMVHTRAPSWTGTHFIPLSGECDSSLRTSRALLQLRGLVLMSAMAR